MRQYFCLIEPSPNDMEKEDGWMDVLRFYIHFNSITVISGRWTDNERLCAMESCLQLRRFRLEKEEKDQIDVSKKV